MATSLVTKSLGRNSARLLANAVISDANSTYYVFAAGHVPRVSSTIPDADDDVRETVVDVYHDMIFAKKVAASDVSLMVRNVPWVSNTVYSMYDDLDTGIMSEAYYVIVNEGSFYHGWKCLDNNQGARSTVSPVFADIDATDELYETVDGYRWKYMYTVDSTTASKFSTSDYFPITANSAVVAAAVDGAIDVIAVSSNGQGYSNYLTGTFSSADIRPSGNSNVYGLSGNSTASALRGFYTGCLLYVSAGTGAGQFSTVNDSFSNSVGNFVVITDQFLVPPQNGSQYQIFPEVVVVGSGQTTNARAMALVNAIGNAVYRVEMLSRGAGYDYAAANVVANAVVGVLQVASVRPIYGPPGGHGARPEDELGASVLSISVDFSNTIGNTVPSNDHFQQVGVVKNPIFSNVAFGLSNAVGAFAGGETVYDITPRCVRANVSVTSGNVTLNLNTTDGASRLFANDYVYLRSQDGVLNMIATVNTVVNSSVVTLNVAPSWSSNTILVSVANVSTTFTASAPSNTSVLMSNSVLGIVQDGDLIIGGLSGAVATVNTISRNGVTKGFGTFVELTGLTASATGAGTFALDETIFQGANLSTSTANAAVFSTNVAGGVLTLLVSNVAGAFVAGKNVQGVNSGAVALLTGQFAPEVDFGSGETLYVQNIDPIQRTNTATQHVNVLLQF